MFLRGSLNRRAQEPTCNAGTNWVYPNIPIVIIDGYVRVSQVGGRAGDSFISPSLQREQIEAWAKSRRVQIATVFERLEESGARADRPMLINALGRVEAGLTDGIVVAKLDRFGRSLLDSLSAIDRIRAAGGTFVAVQDGLDMSTDTGKLVLRVMFSMAEWKLHRIRSQWNTARERAIARGVHMGRCAPVGYLRPDDRRLIPDPRLAPIIAIMFRKRADGASLSWPSFSYRAGSTHGRRMLASRRRTPRNQQSRIYRRVTQRRLRQSSCARADSGSRALGVSPKTPSRRVQSARAQANAPRRASALRWLPDGYDAEKPS